MSPPDLVPALQLPLRAAVAAGLSVAVADLLGLAFPLYALVAAVLVTDLSPAMTRRLGVPRLAGTVLGAGVGAILCAVLGPSVGSGPFPIAVGILAAMFACQVAGLKDATKVAGYVCGIVLLEHARDPWTYALLRLVETTLGIGTAVLVGFVPKLFPVPEPPPERRTPRAASRAR